MVELQITCTRETHHSMRNARVLAAIKGSRVKVDAQVDQPVRNRNRSVAEADKFIQR